MLNKCDKFYRKLSPHTRIGFPQTLCGQRIQDRILCLCGKKKIKIRKVRILSNPLKVLYIFYVPKNETLKAIH